MEREVIYMLADPEKKVLSVHQAFGLVKGDEVVWESCEPEPPVTGPLALNPPCVIYRDAKTDELSAAVFFTVDVGAESWEEFIEVYPLGTDPAKSEALRAELIELFEKKEKQ